MRTNLLLLLLLCGLAANGQSRRIEWPDVRKVWQRAFQISAVELTDSATIVEMKVKERKGRWYAVEGSAVLRDPQGKRYPMLRFESPYGSEQGKRFWPTRNGTGWLKLYFAPLPKGTEWFDYTQKKWPTFDHRGVRLDTLTWAAVRQAEIQRRWDERTSHALAHQLPATVRNLTGKWKCSGEFLHNVGIGPFFPHLSGYYKFRKNGTFTIRINGAQHHSWRDEVYTYSGKLEKLGSDIAKSAYIKVKGTYTIEDGRITTAVRPADVKFYFDQGRSHPDIDNPELQDRNPRWYDMEVSFYEQQEKFYEQMGETVKRELMPLWTWRNESVVVTEDELLIGRKALFSR